MRGYEDEEVYGNEEECEGFEACRVEMSDDEVSENESLMVEGDGEVSVAQEVNLQ